MTLNSVGKPAPPRPKKHKGNARMHFSLVHEIAASPGRLRARASTGFSSRQAAVLERRLTGIEGVTNVRVNRLTGSLLFQYQSRRARDAVCRLLARPQEALFAEADLPAKPSAAAPVPRQSGFRFFPLIQYFFIRPLLPLAVRTVATLFRAVPYILRGAASLGSGRWQVELLDASAIAVSLARRDFRTARVIMLLLGIGEMLEAWTRQKSMASLTESLALNVSEVWLLDGSEERRVPLSSISAGDIVIVRAGSTIPVDGRVVTGDAAVNQATMTGEALPVPRSAGSSVFAGTVVEEGEIHVRVTHVGTQTRLQQVIRFISESENAKAAIQSKSERLANLAVPFTFLLGGLVWMLSRSFTRMSSVLLVDYACALRLSTPLVMLAAMRESAYNGVLVKGGRYLEELSEVDTVVFDKTGTLTQAHPSVVDVIPAAGYCRADILRLAACLEEHFPHPVARAVVALAEAERLQHREEHAEVKYIVAHGVASEWRNMPVVIGSRHYVQHDEGIDITPLQAESDAQAALGRSLLYLGINGRLAGIISIEDPLRDESAAIIARLREAGMQVVMLTGDDERTAAAVARRLGVSAYCSQVLPEDKANIVQRIQKSGRTVAMVGDGINDSPALSAANVGISLSDGTDLAQEVANVLLCHSRLEQLLAARHLACAAMRRIRGNFNAIMTLNSLFMLGGAFGLLTPARSGVLHNTTTVCTTLNAMRPLGRMAR